MTSCLGGFFRINNIFIAKLLKSLATLEGNHLNELLGKQSIAWN